MIQHVMATLTGWIMIHPGDTLTVVGLFLTVASLARNHDLSRRENAARLAAEWNSRTAAHRKAIEQLRPGLVDRDPRHPERFVQLTRVEAQAIYCSKPGDSDLWELRFHFVELLNYFESICVAYRHGVADREMVEESFRNALNHWVYVLGEFIEVVKVNRGYSPWEPFTDLVTYWASRRKPYRFRKMSNRLL
ncbi:MAG: hypothetical protein AB7H96_23405 [Vicinamibacterales bacterium]